MSRSLSREKNQNDSRFKLLVNSDSDAFGGVCYFCVILH